MLYPPTDSSISFLTFDTSSYEFFLAFSPYQLSFEIPSPTICIYEFFINKYRLRAYIVEIMQV